MRSHHTTRPRHWSALLLVGACVAVLGLGACTVPTAPSSTSTTTTTVRPDPIARASYTQDPPGFAGTPVQFSSAGSTWFGGVPGPLTFIWHFGDGETAVEANPAHVYAAAGTYRVVLTVVDSNTHFSSAFLSVTQLAPPG